MSKPHVDPSPLRVPVLFYPNHSEKAWVSIILSHSHITGNKFLQVHILGLTVSWYCEKPALRIDQQSMVAPSPQNNSGGIELPQKWINFLPRCFQNTWDPGRKIWINESHKNDVWESSENESCEDYFPKTFWGSPSEECRVRISAFMDVPVSDHTCLLAFSF